MVLALAPLWHRLIVVAVVVAVSAFVAKLVDVRISRHKLTPGVETRYRILRRSLMVAIVFVGLLSALLVIPQVRGVAGGLLASSAVLSVIIGFAAQRTLGNAVAGLLIAFTQPIRLGDVVTIADAEGTIEEIALTHTVVRAPDNTRVVVPNERLVSDTIRNATLVSRETLAQITVQVPLDTDLQGVLDVIRKERIGDREPEVLVSALDGSATITVRTWAPTETAAERLEGELRLRLHAVLRERGVWHAP
jgi:small-conductance mechanosensitive channel